MVAPVYATLAEAGGPPITNDLLAIASGIVDEVLIGAIYTVDSDQKPTDTAIAEALRDATIAQAKWMDTTGDTTGTGDVIEVDSASIGSVSFSGQQRATLTARTPSGAQVAAGTIRALRVAGILPVGVIVYG